MNSRLGVIIVAAGSSSRMGGVDKVFADLHGRPVLAWSIETFGRMPEVIAAVLVLSSMNLERGRALVRGMSFGKDVACVPGGARRQDSVRAGLDALAGAGPGFDFIAVHDGARPFVDEAMVRRGLAAALATGAAIAAVPVKDTIKAAGPDRIVTGTPDRRALWAVQTPQVFAADVILDAHRRVSQEVTDDASMVELTGGRVSVFDGHPENIKITTPDDYLLAGLIAARRAGEPGSVVGDGTSPVAPARSPSTLRSFDKLRTAQAQDGAGSFDGLLRQAPSTGSFDRLRTTSGQRQDNVRTTSGRRRKGRGGTRLLSVPGSGWGSRPEDPGSVRFGTGFDGHKLVPPGPLRLGGVDIAFDMRLAGHSDGDVLLHAVASAFLGAAGLGDLGRHFPSTDPSLKRIDSRVLLSRSLDLVRGGGWSPEYVDATIIAERPKLAAYLDQMAAAIAEAAGLAPGHVNVKVTSTDGVGAIGEGQGIAAQAVASIRRTGAVAESP